MPRSAGLFHRAIAESGPLASWGAHTLADADEQYQALLQRTHCDKSTFEAQVTCLQALDAAVVQQHSVRPSDAFEDWGPVVDGVELPEAPIELARKGRWASRVPLLIGSNKNEVCCFEGHK